MPKVREDEEGGVVEKPVDAAGRIVLPSELAKEFDTKIAYLIFWLTPCLRLVSPEKFGELKRDVLGEINDPIQREWIHRRTFGTRRKVMLDENNRIRIPTFYLERLGLPLKGARVLLTRFDDGIVEIWNPKTFDQLVMEIDFTSSFWREQVEAQQIASAAEQIELVLRLRQLKAELEAKLRELSKDKANE